MSVGSPRILNALSIAGSDPSGGAGIQADLKTFSALGVYGLAVLTSLTAQNTRGVRAVHVPPSDFLREQLEAISDDVRVDTVKIGMLADAEVAGAVADWLERVRPDVVVLDPVMVATSGDRLLDPAAVEVVRDRLVPLAGLITPNLPELAVLVDQGVSGPRSARSVPTWDDALADAAAFAAGRGVRILVKGGHLSQGQHAHAVPDALVEPDGTVHVVTAERVRTTSTHGTGCTLSSAVAALRPRRQTWLEAVADAKTWLTGALGAAHLLEVGGADGGGADSGGADGGGADGSAGGTSHGPVHHFHQLWPVPQPGNVSFTAEAWRRIADVREAVDELPFVRALADGSLAPKRFLAYLQQDALYLEDFARALAWCAQLAPSVQEQSWWLGHARECLVAERALHERELADSPPVGRSPVTRAYTDHLLAAAARSGYAVLAAAVLPCFWIYADVGTRLQARSPGPVHPYRDWIEQYADPGFAQAAQELRDLVDRLAVEAGDDERAAMLEAFVVSARYEWSFWDHA